MTTPDTERATVTQADRDAAADFEGQAWHLFRPNDPERAKTDATDIRAGRCDNWHLVQAFARHREQALSLVRTEWRPIEEAPKDGTKVDLWFHRPAGATAIAPEEDSWRVTDCFWAEDGWRRERDDGDGLDPISPRYITHFMKLPDPPIRNLPLPTGREENQ